jgi:Fructose-2,6-bisphosphatase
MNQPSEAIHAEHKMPMTRLFLVRHGETEHSSEDAFCGVTEAPLTARGHQQASALAAYLHDRQLKIDALYCSPQLRAQDTARPLAEALALQIQLRDALREINFGRWENRSRADLSEDYALQLAAWERGSWMTTIPNGETQQAVIARVIPCIVDLLTRHNGQTLLLVSHRATLRLLISHLLGMSLSESRGLRIDTASLSELRFIGDNVYLHCFNDTHYLES